MPTAHRSAPPRGTEPRSPGSARPASSSGTTRAELDRRSPRGTQTITGTLSRVVGPCVGVLQNDVGQLVLQIGGPGVPPVVLFESGGQDSILQPGAWDSVCAYIAGQTRTKLLAPRSPSCGVVLLADRQVEAAKGPGRSSLRARLRKEPAVRPHKEARRRSRWQEPKKEARNVQDHSRSRRHHSCAGTGRRSVGWSGGVTATRQPVASISRYRTSARSRSACRSWGG